jgi:hypothetical protein
MVKKKMEKGLAILVATLLMVSMLPLSGLTDAQGIEEADIPAQEEMTPPVPMETLEADLPVEDENPASDLSENGETEPEQPADDEDPMPEFVEIPEAPIANQDQDEPLGNGFMHIEAADEMGTYSATQILTKRYFAERTNHGKVLRPEYTEVFEVPTTVELNLPPEVILDENGLAYVYTGYSLGSFSDSATPTLSGIPKTIELTSDNEVKINYYYAKGIVVTFDAQDGTAAEPPRYYSGTDTFDRHGLLPDLTHSNTDVLYEFDGWYAQPDGKGLKAGSSGHVVEFFQPGTIGTLYANWIRYYEVCENHISEENKDILKQEVRIVKQGENYKSADFNVPEARLDLDGKTYLYEGASVLDNDASDEFSTDEMVEIIDVDRDYQVYYHYRTMSTNVNITYPARINFAALLSNGGAITADVYKFENNSDFPVIVSFDGMWVTNSPSALLWREHATAAGEIELAIAFPTGDGGMNGFTATPSNTANIVPNDDAGRFLGKLNGQYFGDSLSNTGYITLRGRFMGPFHSSPMRPDLELVFSFQLEEE